MGRHPTVSPEQPGEGVGGDDVGPLQAPRPGELGMGVVDRGDHRSNVLDEDRGEIVVAGADHDRWLGERTLDGRCEP